MTRIAVLDEERLSEVDGGIEAGRLRITPEGVEQALGWELRPQGLCRGDACIPVARHEGLVEAAGVDLARFARLLDRPVALDLDERAISLGASAAERGAALRSGTAPDFELPDLAGRLHSLSEQRGKKVLLVAYASW